MHFLQRGWNRHPSGGRTGLGMKLKEERNLTYIFITHNLSVVEYISDRIAVMYLGKIAAHVDRLKDITDNLPLLLLILDAEVPERVRKPSSQSAAVFSTR